MKNFKIKADSGSGVFSISLTQHTVLSHTNDFEIIICSGFFSFTVIKHSGLKELPLPVASIAGSQDRISSRNLEKKSWKNPAFWLALGLMPHELPYTVLVHLPRDGAVDWAPASPSTNNETSPTDMAVDQPDLGRPSVDTPFSNDPRLCHIDSQSLLGHHLILI